MAHLVKARRDQARETDNIYLFFNSAIDDIICRYHDPHVYDIKIITLQNNTHNILADIMDIALNRSHQNLTLAGRLNICASFLSLFFFHIHKRLKISHSFFHHTGRFDHLRQKHLTVTKQIPNPIHAIH